jgi:hypothetical protein
MRTTATKMTPEEVDAEIVEWRLRCKKQEREAWRSLYRAAGYTIKFNNED